MARRKRVSRPPSIRGGSGKGGGEGRVAKEDPDSLTSRQSAKLIEVISEGEIAGFGDPDHPLRCVALDGTPVENSDGSLNFKNFDLFFLPGTQAQSYLPGFEAAADITVANTKITTSTPWTHRFSDETKDAIRLDIRFPRLQKQNKSNGDITGTEVRLKIYVKEQADTVGAVFVLKVDDLIKGKASNPYVRGYKLELAGMTAPWDIRIERVTSDHDETQAIADDTYIESYSQITYGKLRYPNTALIGIKVDAEQFGTSIPTRAYKMKGLIIEVPANYDPVTRDYATTGPGTSMGEWDGTFKLAHSNSPPWCFRDMALSKRYGLGNFLSDAQINKWELYAIAKYCDGWNARPGNPDNDYGPTGKHGVPDGKGGWEPRFACNLFLQKAEDAMKVLSDMATIFRGMHYFAEGTLIPIQDRPTEPSIQVGPANVLNGVFRYSGTGRKARHTAALVSYNDQNNFSKLTPEPYDDQDAIIKYGYNPLSITNIGCTSQMCARRAGKWALTAERILTDTVTFSVGAAGFNYRLGRVAQVTDPLKGGAEFSGLIKARTATTMTLDIPVTLEAEDYWVYFTFFDTAAGADKVKGVLVTNGPGTTSVLTFAAQADLPNVETMWQIGSASRPPKLYKIIDATPSQDRAYVDVVGLQYDASLFDYIDDDAPLDEPVPSPLPSPLFVIPIKPKIYPDGKTTADSYIFESASDRFDQSWVGHRITATGVTGAVVKSVQDPRHLTMDEPASVTAATVEYEFSAIGCRQVALTDNVQGVTRDLHIGWVQSADLYVRGYRAAYRMENGNWTTLPENGACEAIIEGVIPGIYEVAVVVVNRFGKTSTPANLDINVDVVNPLEGATVEGLEIVGQGSVTDYALRDVPFRWKINSPAMAAQELEDDARFDPFFESFIVTIYEAGTTNIRQQPIEITQAAYTHTLEKNTASAQLLGIPAYGDFTIGVKIRDRFNNISEEARLTVHKLPPPAPILPGNLIPTLGGINVQWTNVPDASRDRNDILIDNPLSDPVASTSGESSQKAIDGIPGNSYRYFLVRAVDCYGNKSAVLELGWAKPGQVNDIPEVQFLPDGGAVDFLGSGVSNVHMAHANPEAEIWFRVNSPGSIPTNITAEGNIKYFDGLLAVNPPDTGATFTARALVNGIWGPVSERTFTLNPSGGGGGTTDAVIAPEFSPTPGIDENPAGEADIAFGTPGADTLFYTHTANGSTPDDPTHDGSGNPTGTTIKVVGDSAGLTIARGTNKFKAIAIKAGLDDSSIASATYQIRKTAGGLEL